MTTRYSAPFVEAIQEGSEDESKDGIRDKEGQSVKDHSYRRSRSSMDAIMAPTRVTVARERDRPKRKHRSKEGRSKRPPRPQGKTTTMKVANGAVMTDSGSDGQQRSRHRRTYSNRSTSSTSSSSEEDEPIQDHREVLAAASARLTSPSMISTFTSLTTSTNKSSGSSGSNSTVTQASITKRSSLGKRAEIAESPLSPAVPDPPSVFAFLDNESAVGTTHEEGEEEEEEAVELRQEEEGEQDEGGEHDSPWLNDEHEPSFDSNALPSHLSPDQSRARDSSSSTSSSLHGSDHFSEPAIDNDTDRSTSPERSVKDHASDHEPESAPMDRASARMASQMAAAQQRQNLHGSMQQLGASNMPQRTTIPPRVPSKALSSRHSQNIQRQSLPGAQKLPATGYELLATRLSSYNSPSDFEDGTIIKPMYRKFGALNHRLLLHLQDELSELEEQLHRLDHADTQSRWAGREGRVVPASRRAASAQGGDLQWHKTDILGKIGFKLAQYSSFLLVTFSRASLTSIDQALSSFNTTQSLSPPASVDIDTYREYLSTENPIVEAETHFLDPSDDLVSICSSIPPPSAPISNESQSQPLSRAESQTSATAMRSQSMVTYEREPQAKLQGLAVAIAVAVLVPILTFNVIPGFIGRLTVVGLVASGVVFALMQAGVVGKGCFGRDGLICAGIYGGVMIVIAGIVV